MAFVEATRASVGLFSLSTKNTVYHSYVIDLSTFRDPLGQANFKPLDGRAKEVQEWIKLDPRFPAIRDACRQIVADVIGGQKRTWLSIAFKDFHGTHISPAVAELIAHDLLSRGYSVGVTHVAFPPVLPQKGA